MASSLVDLVKINVGNTGSGAITLGSAVEGYRGREVLTNGTVYSYSIQQGSAWEFGRGTYLSSGNQFIRSPIDSSDGGTAIALKPNAQVAFTALSADLMPKVQLTQDIQAKVDAAEAAQAGAETAQGLSEDARDQSVAAKDISVTKAGEAAASAAAAADAATQLSSDFLNDGLAFAVVDDYGFATMTVDTAGQMIATTIAVQTVATAELTPTGPDLTIAGDGIAIVDDYGFVVARIDPDGVETATSAATPVVPQNDYARHIVGVYGQSLSSGTAARPPISTAQRYGNKMLTTGVRVNGLADATINAATLADLIESESDSEGETPVSGHCDAVLQLLDAENAAGWPTHQFRLLGFAPGKPSTAIAGLSKTTTPYNTAKTALARLVALSPDDPVVHLAMDWVQGESDIQNGTARATYKTALKTLRTDWEADAQAITGQAEGVKLLSYQGCSHSAYNVATPDIALAQIDAATEDANIVIVTPDYIFRRADNVHLIAADSWLMGAYFGAAYKRIFLDGGTWETVRPVSKTIRGASCDVRFRVPHGPLVFDTSAVTNPGNYGFKMVDSGGSALTITAVTLMGPDWVRITCSGTIPTGSKVRYAWGTFSGVTAAGPSTGPRGNLRDSAGGALKVTDPTGLVRPLHNWCELFEI